MEHYVVKNSGGDPVLLLEVTPTPDMVEQLSALRGGRPPQDRVLDGLSSLGVAISETCEAVIKEVRSSLADLAPDEFELTFQLSISAEGGLPTVVKAGSDASFTVNATWRR